jgi:hypothetical protein
MATDNSKSGRTTAWFDWYMATGARTYRVAKDPNTGLVMYVMPRRLAEDGKSYVATILNNDGTVFRVRRFVRVD